MARNKGSEINIPTILKVEKDAISGLGADLKDHKLDEVVIFFGNGLIDMFGERVFDSCREASVSILSYQELDDVNIETMTSMAFSISNRAKAVIGIGGGKVIDAAKYMGYLRQLPFISVPTSSSSDGFASASASLLVEGKRVSVPAAMAFGIIVDTEVIRTAPDKFLYSGIGDMVSKITANYDWLFEAEHKGNSVDDFAMMIAKKAVNSFVRVPFEDIHEQLFLKELLDSLAMSGIANEIAGGSAPTSGSEHLISHALDKIGEQPQLHGIQVGIATYIMALVQDHRYIRIRTILTKTGFFDYCKTLGLSKDLWIRAIDMAPAIKPHRYTYIHEDEYREMAKRVLVEDDILKQIFA
ncbi:MAG: iron-containing alcohol dehydrogenase family protein [Lachnospiraceae bacterium]|nr:iron-containing alcohol dehydrogenase family protein [Candidatus Merdinaster equi]